MKNLRVFDVSCAGGPDAQSASPTAQIYAAIVVEVLGYNLDGDTPFFSVVGPSTIGRRVRDAIADGISNLYQRGLAAPLTKALRARTQEGTGVDATTTYDLATSKTLLTDMITSVSVTAAQSEINERHEDAVTIAKEMDDSVNSVAAYEGRAELLVGGVAHRQLLLTTLRHDAMSQVVIAAPRISELSRDKEIQDALVEAVGRGIRVHLLWGTPQAKPTDDLAPLQNLIDLLHPGEQRTGGLFISKHPVKLGVSALACDLQRVVIGNFDWFGNDPWRANAIAFVLPSIASRDEQNPRTQVPTAVLEAVHALRQACPEAALRRVITAEADIEGGRPILRERSPLAYPAAPDAGMSLSIKIWQDEWRRWLSDLDSIQNADARTVRLIPRGGHRRELVRALEQAKKRLILVSTRLGEGALGAAIEPHIRSALDRGVELRFYHRDILPRQDLIEQLRQYQRRGLSSERCNVDGSFIICDTRALVGSFEFGKSDGERGALELGFDVRDPAFTDGLLRFVATLESISPTSANASFDGDRVQA